MTKLGKPLTPLSASEYVNIIREKPPPFNLKRWIYDSKEGTVFGRTAGSWGKILCLLDQQVYI